MHQMNSAEILAAADSFVRHFRRRDGDDVDQAWADWTRFRRLSSEDAAKIRSEADQVLRSIRNTEPPPQAA